MRKIPRVIFIVFAVVFSAFSLLACADAGAPDHDVSEPNYSVSVSSLERKLEDFLSKCENRTTYTDGERKAAEYLNALLAEYGYSDTSVRDFSVSETVEVDGVKQEKKVTSRNTVAVYSQGADAQRKNVVLCAYYDNRYSQPFSGAGGGFGASAALSNGTGVATLLGIAEYLQRKKPSLDFNVTIAFLGASAVSNVGAQRLYNDMTAKQRDSTVLVVELQRIGAEHVYAFSDARNTKREAFFDGIAEENGLDIYKTTQRSPIVGGMSALNGVPYFQWSHSGVFPVFFNAGIPTINIVGADWETMDLTDNDRVSFTESDTLKNLKDNNPHYSENMAAAATLVIEAMESDGFLTAMQYDRDNFPDTDVLEKEWIWYVIVLGVLLVAAAAMYFVVSRLSKKYPITVPQPKKMKMAVFGMDYEDKDPDNIYIDIQPVDRGEEIFPGVPNNEQTKKTPFDDIFPPFVPPTTIAPHVRETEEAEDPKREAPAEAQTERIEEAPTVREQAKAEQEREPIKEEQTAQEPLAEFPAADGEGSTSSAVVEDAQNKDQGAAEEHDKPAEQTKKPTARKQSAASGAASARKTGATGGTTAPRKPNIQTKRKTVSAGKSTHKSGEETKSKDE